MSALRVSRPGHPTQLLDLGPAVGRITHTRGAVGGGVYVVGESERARDLRLQREAMARQRGALLEATTPARRAQMAAYRESRK
jgi:hypothetical protein